MAKDKLIQIRVSEEEYGKIKNKADEEFRSISNYILKIVLSKTQNKETKEKELKKCLFRTLPI